MDEEAWKVFVADTSRSVFMKGWKKGRLEKWIRKPGRFVEPTPAERFYGRLEKWKVGKMDEEAWKDCGADLEVVKFMENWKDWIADPSTLPAYHLPQLPINKIGITQSPS
jgi:hypothetical protein